MEGLENPSKFKVENCCLWKNYMFSPLCFVALPAGYVTKYHSITVGFKKVRTLSKAYQGWNSHPPSGGESLHYTIEKLQNFFGGVFVQPALDTKVAEN